MIQSAHHPDEPSVSIIIVTWNCRDYVLRCLETVYANEAITFEIIIRDNGSEDGTRSAIAAKYPQVQFIGDGRNVGFAAANNEAITQAKGDYLLLLNPDTELPPTALADFVEMAQTHHEQAVIVPTLLNSDGTLQPSLHSFPTLTGLLKKRVASLKGQASHEQLVWVKGACLLIPKPVYQAVGDLDDHLFMYGEDLDYCWRIHQAGFEIVWTEHIQIIHHGNVSGRQKWGSQRLARTSQALIYFWMKHFGFFQTILLILFRVVYLAGQGLIDVSRSNRNERAASLERWFAGAALVRASLDPKTWALCFSTKHQD